MRNLARMVFVMAAQGLLCTLAASPAGAQRVQFAAPLSQVPAPGTAPAPTFAPPAGAPLGPAPVYAPAPGTGVGMVSPPAVSAPGATPLAPGSALGQPMAPYGAPGYAPPPVYGPSPGVAPGAAVGAPPATWDPYATPGNTPSALLPQDPYFQSVAPPVSMAAMQKFLQHVDLDYHWFAGHNGQTVHEELGINDVELSATFAFPLFKNAATPLLITPGFAVHYWEGPLSPPPPPPPAPMPDVPPDLPAQTYDAYLDVAWNPQINAWLGAELDFRIGVYSDFNNVTTKAVRFPSKGLFVLSLSPSVKIKAGVWYLDRNVVKILPAGGICWTPNPDVYFNILFPNPKIAKRLTTWGNTDWWLYASGDYGGGKWQITRQNGLDPNPYMPDTNGMLDTFDYNDIRVAVGLEFHTPGQLHGLFEVGGAFQREVIYESYLPHAYYPNNTVFARAGLSY